MDKSTILNIKSKYEDALYNNIVAFWLKHSLDLKHGGYYTALDREGNIIDSDKSVWFQGRFAWILSTLYADFDKNPKYLESAKMGIDFLEQHCFDSDGRMFFRVSSDGKPVIKRTRYFFSETFCIIAMAAYSRASGDKSYSQKARALWLQIEKYRTSKGILEPKFNEDNRASLGFAVPMIMLSVTQSLRLADLENKLEYDSYIDKCLKEMSMFIHEDKKAVLEQINPDGSLQDHFEGRLLNPGHSIEGAWFVMDEGNIRQDDKIKSLGLKMFDFMWEWGWDKEYGGIIYFQDVLNKPKSEYWHDMKFWWPQNEAAIASLYAYFITGDIKYFEKHEMVMEWSNKFIDDLHGEWYGYLHRDGSVSTTLKGNMYKGPFHIPRMYMTCIKLLNLMSK